MSDPDPGTPAPAAVPAATAGGMLRAARQARGLHVAALAASIKVTQRKLESLEGDRYDELPDMTFTRALAKTVCRSLKVDSEPVLALLPRLGDQGLDKVHQGLNTAFRERPGRLVPTDLSALTRPAVWVPLLVLLVAAGIFLLPQHWIADLGAPAAGASAAVPPAAAASPAVRAQAAAVVAEPAPVLAPLEPASAPVAAPSELGSALELRVAGESWVEVLDADGAALLRRSLQPGEVVGLDGTPPFRLKIGNAAATQLKYRGQPVDLAVSTRDNIARLELK